MHESEDEGCATRGALHVQQGQQESGGTPHAEFQDPGTQEEENPHRCAAKSFSGDLCGARGPREEGCATEDSGETMARSFRRENPRKGSRSPPCFESLNLIDERREVDGDDRHDGWEIRPRGMTDGWVERRRALME